MAFRNWQTGKWRLLRKLNFCESSNHRYGGQKINIFNTLSLFATNSTSFYKFKDFSQFSQVTTRLNIELYSTLRDIKFGIAMLSHDVVKVIDQIGEKIESNNLELLTFEEIKNACFMVMGHIEHIKANNKLTNADHTKEKDLHSYKRIILQL